jgi:cell division protein FtsB
MAQKSGSPRPQPGRTRRVPVALPHESAPEHWLRTIRLSGFPVIMLGLLILAVIVLAPNLRIFIEQQQQIASLRQGLSSKQASVDLLTKDVARWSDPAYIESQARERLLYVFPGDISYLVVGAGTGTTTADGQPISAQLQTTKIDWLRSLVGSIYTAGLTDAPPSRLVAPTVGGTK